MTDVAHVLLWVSGILGLVAAGVGIVGMFLFSALVSDPKNRVKQRRNDVATDLCMAAILPALLVMVLAAALIGLDKVLP